MKLKYKNISDHDNYTIRISSHHDSTITKYLCHKLSWICPVYRNHYHILFLFMIYHRVYNKNNMTGVNSGTGIPYAWVHTPFVSRVHVAQTLVFLCSVLYVIVWVFFFPFCCLSFHLRLLHGYPLGIIKLLSNVLCFMLYK